LRPAYALALLLLVPLLVRNAPTGAPTTIPQQVLVQFRLDAPDASDVALAGNFSDWQPKHHLTRTAGGVWTVTIPLEQGVYRYAFVVNGRSWQPDPLAPAVSDGFGGQNSQIAVLRPDQSVES
jgi:1,4-alpha-glucan branching enzyme